MPNRHAISVPLLVLFLASGCGGAAPADQGGGVASATGGAQIPPAPTVTGAEARQLVADGAVLLDVTPADRAAESAIEGRTHIPMGELRDRMSELPRDRPIVVYCLGGGGSPGAGALLQSEGFDVRVMGARNNWDEGATDPSPRA